MSIVNKWRDLKCWAQAISPTNSAFLPFSLFRTRTTLEGHGLGSHLKRTHTNAAVFVSAHNHRHELGSIESVFAKAVGYLIRKRSLESAFYWVRW